MKKRNSLDKNIESEYLKYLKKQRISLVQSKNKFSQLKLFYLPICNDIYKTFIRKRKTILIGLSGAQGTGKTTIAGILKIILKKKFNLEVVTISIDDFYKTRSQRREMSNKIHKLFLTRGVPGTHEIPLIKKTLNGFIKKKFKSILIPRFDKSSDNRYLKKYWYKLKKKPQIVIFEGWCIFAKHQNDIILRKPINTLEKKNDINLVWRKKVNDELKTNYKKIFNLLDKNIFLKVPNFKYVFKWRLLQEKKLKKRFKGKKIMNYQQIKKFIMHYERITQQMLKDYKRTSDIVLKINKRHQIDSIKFF